MYFRGKHSYNMSEKCKLRGYALKLFEMQMQLWTVILTFYENLRIFKVLYHDSSIIL